MQYIRLIDDRPEVYSVALLRRAHPNTSFPKNPSDALLASFGVYPLVRAEPPSDVDPLTLKIVDGPIQKTSDGNWVQTLDVVRRDLDDAADRVRRHRTALLAESDWTQVADAPVDQPAWATYRQALRDLTEQPGFPWSVEWPAQPS